MAIDRSLAQFIGVDNAYRVKYVCSLLITRAYMKEQKKHKRKAQQPILSHTWYISTRHLERRRKIPRLFHD